MEFFKPKWKSVDAFKRIEWISKATYKEKHLQILRNMSVEDSDNSVADKAVRKIIYAVDYGGFFNEEIEQALIEIANESKYREVRCLAISRINNETALAQIGKVEEDIKVCGEGLSIIENQDIIIDLALTAMSQKTRLVAVGHVKNQEILINIVKNRNEEFKVRKQALSKITKSAFFKELIGIT